MREQPFDVEVAGVRVPGLMWTPPGDGPYPLVLMGHGVASHKRSDTNAMPPRYGPPGGP